MIISRNRSSASLNFNKCCDFRCVAVNQFNEFQIPTTRSAMLTTRLTTRWFQLSSCKSLRSRWLSSQLVSEHYANCRLLASFVIAADPNLSKLANCPNALVLLDFVPCLRQGNIHDYGHKTSKEKSNSMNWFFIALVWIKSSKIWLIYIWGSCASYVTLDNLSTFNENSFSWFQAFQVDLLVSRLR